MTDAKKDVESGWQSSTSGERAWKEATERVEARNVAARKAGRQEREQYERKREHARHTADAERDAKLAKRRTP